MYSIVEHFFFIVERSVVSCEGESPRLKLGFLIFDVAEWEYFADAVTWEVADQTCRDEGGSMVSILTEGQNSALRNFVLESDPNAARLWLGGNDLVVEVGSLVLVIP